MPDETRPTTIRVMSADTVHAALLAQAVMYPALKNGACPWRYVLTYWQHPRRDGGRIRDVGSMTIGGTPDAGMSTGYYPSPHTTPAFLTVGRDSPDDRERSVYHMARARNRVSPRGTSAFSTMEYSVHCTRGRRSTACRMAAIPPTPQGVGFLAGVL